MKKIYVVALLGLLVVGVFPTELRAQTRWDSLRNANNFSGNLWNVKNRPSYQIMSREAYREAVRRGAIAPEVGCDTTNQQFILLRRRSAWRLGGFLGPSYIWCGSWDGTVGGRDQTMYNSIGGSVGLSADYLWNLPWNRRNVWQLGLGVLGGYNAYSIRDEYRRDVLEAARLQGIPENRINFLDQGISDNIFVLIGPVASFPLAIYGENRKPQRRGETVTLDVSAKAGLFRDTPATLTAVTIPENKVFYMVSPTGVRHHFGYYGSVGVTWPINHQWGLGGMVGVFQSAVNYNEVGADATVYPFRRRNGGLTAAVTVRRTLENFKLLPVAPAAPLICEPPVLTVTYQGQPLNGRTLALDSIPVGIYPVISWRSQATEAANETFTVRLHYKTPESDSIVWQRDSLQSGGQLPWDSIAPLRVADRPAEGFYYVTGHSRQQTLCSVCISEAATTSFAFRDDTTCLTTQPCTFRHAVRQITAVYPVTLRDSVQCVCYCEGQVSYSGKKRLRVRRQYRSALVDTTALSRSGQSLSFLSDSLTLRLPDAFMGVQRSINYKGKWYKPSYYKVLYSIDQRCPDQPDKRVSEYEVLVRFTDGQPQIYRNQQVDLEEQLYYQTPAKKTPRKAPRTRRK